MFSYFIDGTDFLLEALNDVNNSHSYTLNKYVILIKVSHHYFKCAYHVTIRNKRGRGTSHFKRQPVIFSENILLVQKN